jgi:hypothetical protein
MKNHKLIILSMAFSGLLMIISIAQAQVYSWTDENGNVRFSDDFSQVPEKYRKVAVPVGPSKERMQELRRTWAEGEQKISYDGGKTWVEPGAKRINKEPQRQVIEKRPDMMEEMVRKFAGLTYEWTQEESLWIRIPASTVYAKEMYSEMAEKIAAHYHAQKGHMVCVRFYYESGKVIAYECR